MASQEAASFAIQSGVMLTVTPGILVGDFTDSTERLSTRCHGLGSPSPSLQLRLLKLNHQARLKNKSNRLCVPEDQHKALVKMPWTSAHISCCVDRLDRIDRLDHHRIGRLLRIDRLGRSILSIGSIALTLDGSV